MSIDLVEDAQGHHIFTCTRHCFDGDYQVSFPLSRSEEETLRDRLINFYSVQNDTPYWRKDGEWVEVSLNDAKPGDIAEFYRVDIGKTCWGKLSPAGSGLDIRKEDFIGCDVVSDWCIRLRNGIDGGGMRDLHIWRKLDPHRFDEPEKVGCYATQSGTMLYNDGYRPNWMLLDDKKWEDSKYVEWVDVRKQLDDSEFPLVEVTPEMIRKAVES